MSAASPPGLVDVQRWLCAAVLPGDGPRGAVADTGPAAAVELEGVVCASPRQSAAECLAIYRHGYTLRLLECMRATYPALRHALGAALFDEFALAYLHAHPSRDYSLRNLGGAFAEHLAATRPDRDGRAERGEPWPDFIVDLARLEWLVAAIYEGPGLEDRPARSRPVVPRHLERRWAGAIVDAAPSVRLLGSTYPVGRYLLDVYRGRAPALPMPEPAFLALGRCNYIVRLHELTRASYLILESLISGATLGTAVQRAAVPMDGGAWGLFRSWVQSGLFAEVSMPARA